MVTSPLADSSLVAEERDEHPPASHVRLGLALGNKFRINRMLGEGGMGFIVHATHVPLDEPMALKFLRRDLLAVPGIVERFAQEARAASKLKSEHAVRVFDVGFSDDGLPYIVMEYLEGADLAEVLRARGPLPIEEAVRCIVEACHALAEAHALGIVHRDVKSENLFLTERHGQPARVKVLDFGISKFRAAGDSVAPEALGATMTMGSPPFMSPEQLQSTDAVDLRADIWSLGVVLYQLLSNTLPFDPSLPFDDIANAVMNATPSALLDVAPHVPSDLQAVVMRCLEKSPVDRYPNAAELARALAPFASEDARHLIDTIVDGPGNAPVSETGRRVKGPSTPTTTPPSSRPIGAMDDEGDEPMSSPLSADIERGLIQLLAARVGPFAKVFVQRLLRARCEDTTTNGAHPLENLAVRLATKIPRAEDRRLFLDEVEAFVRSKGMV